MGWQDDPVAQPAQSVPAWQNDKVVSAPTGTTRIARDIGQGAIGLNDTIAEYAGAPVDAATYLLRKAGLDIKNPIGGSESIKKGIDYVATLPGRVSDAVSNGSLQPLTEDRTSRFEPANTEERIARGTGQGIGNALAIALPAGAVAGATRGGTLTNSVANALATAPVTQALSGAAQGGVTEATDNPYLGMAAGVAVPVGIGAARRVISPVRNQLTPQEQTLATAADREGIPLTAGQSTGSPTLQMIESTMAKMPGSAGPMKQALEEQRSAFNRSVLAKAGVDAEKASPEVLETAFQKAGQNFDDLASRTTLNVDPQFESDLSKVEQNYGRRLTTDVAPVFRSYMDDLAPLIQQATTPGANPQIAGEIYQNIRSDITRRMRQIGGKDPTLQDALGGIVDAMDGAMQRSATPDLQQAWGDARRQYQALVTVDKAMQGGKQGERAAANIPFSSLRTAVLQGDRRGFSRGRGQLNELSRIGDFLADKVPNSGTATREVIANPLHWPWLVGANVGSRIYSSAPVQGYLTNQLASGATPYRDLLAAQSARQALTEATGGRNALSRRDGR